MNSNNWLLFQFILFLFGLFLHIKANDYDEIGIVHGLLIDFFSAFVYANMVVTIWLVDIQFTLYKL